MSCRLGKLTPQHLHCRATPESAPAREATAEAALRRDGRRTAAGRTMSRPRARLRPKTARHGARRRAPATQHSTAHPGHRPQRRVRVGRVRGTRVCGVASRTPAHLVVTAWRQTLSHSVRYCNGPRGLPVVGGGTPAEPSPHAAARGLDALRAHGVWTALGREAAARRARGPGSGRTPARPRAPWTCEDEGAGEVVEVGVSAKEGRGGG